MAQVKFLGHLKITGPLGGTYAARVLVLDQSSPPQVLAQKTGSYGFVGSNSEADLPSVITDVFSAIPGTQLSLAATLIDGAGAPVATLNGTATVPGLSFTGSFTPSARSVRMTMA